MLWMKPRLKRLNQGWGCHWAALIIMNRILLTGTCLQLFANWRPSARCKLSCLIWQQIFCFVNKQVKVSNISKENQQMALVVCQCQSSEEIFAVYWLTLKWRKHQFTFNVDCFICSFSCWEEMLIFLSIKI